MRSLRWWSLLLVPGGFVAGHELGYQGAAAIGATPVAAGAHGYLSSVVLVGAPFAFAALARTVLAGVRAELPPVRMRTLAAAQVGLFLAVELAEHLQAGLSPARTLAQPAVVLGLAAQVAVAAVLVLILRSSQQAAAAVASARRRAAPQPRSRPPVRPVPARDLVPLIVAVSSLSRRGPPLSPVV